ncbi:MAG: hypothetical protein ACK559_19470, partial [bacterium]
TQRRLKIRALRRGHHAGIAGTGQVGELALHGVEQPGIEQPVALRRGPRRRVHRGLECHRTGDEPLTGRRAPGRNLCNARGACRLVGKLATCVGGPHGAFVLNECRGIPGDRIDRPQLLARRQVLLHGGRRQ